MCGTSLYTLWDDSRLVFDGQQVDHLLLLCPRQFPRNLLVTTNDVRAPLLTTVHRPAGTPRHTKQTHLSHCFSNAYSNISKLYSLANDNSYDSRRPRSPTGVCVCICFSYHDDRSLVMKEACRAMAVICCRSSSSIMSVGRLSRNSSSSSSSSVGDEQLRRSKPKDNWEKTQQCITGDEERNRPVSMRKTWRIMTR